MFSVRHKLPWLPTRVPQLYRLDPHQGDGYMKPFYASISRVETGADGARTETVVVQRFLVQGLRMCTVNVQVPYREVGTEGARVRIYTAHSIVARAVWMAGGGGCRCGARTSRWGWGPDH